MKHLIVANWKMSPNDPKRARDIFDIVKGAVAKLRSVQIIIAPPSIFLQSLASKYKGNKISLCAQNISSSEDIANTGSLSAVQVANSGGRYVMIGHSEVGDTLDNLRVKTFLTVKHGMIPIIFIGESERDKLGKYLKNIKLQINTALKELQTKEVENVIFCYEPIWAIGQDDPMDSYDIHATVLYIRKVLIEVYGDKIGQNINILYGGSVNSNNIKDILSIDDVNGVVTGRVSTDTEEFVELLKIANRT